MNRGLLLSVNTLVLYGLTFAVGLVAAFRHIIIPQAGTVAQLEPTLQNALIFAAVFVGFSFFIVRFARFASSSLKFFLLLALVAGIEFVLAGWLAWPYALGGAVAFLLVYQLVPIVLIHDVAIIVGIAGVSALMGLSVTPLMACSLLALLAVYDIISVYRTRHMVALAGRMMETGSVFGFLVPSRPSGFFVTTREALGMRGLMLLGSGDVALPLVLAASTVSVSIGTAVMVAGFSLIGVTLMHWLFAHQENPMPMAALPPIAASAILGFLLATLLKL